MQQKDSITILQLSDLHLFKDCGEEFLKVNPFWHLEIIVDEILSRKGKIYPDIVIVTGDISQDYSLESYKIAKTLLNRIGVPIYATMGNHDDSSNFYREFGLAEQVVSVHGMPEWEIVLLNTSVDQEVYGFLSSESINLFRDQAKVKKYQFLFMHHPLFMVDSAWLDGSKVINNIEFFNVLNINWLFNNKQEQICLKGIFAGHVHQENYFNYRGVPFFTAPAVAWQFASLSDNFGLGKGMPGYRWIRIYKNGNFSTMCKHLDYNEEFLPDKEVRGY